MRAFNATKYKTLGVSALSITLALSEGERIWGFGQSGINNLDMSGQCLQTAPQNG